jgi:hypothetical protein
MLTAAATVSLTGPLALQGRQAARGLELWASTDQIHLQISDDAGSATTARDVYRRWLGGQVDLLIGPYGSSLVRQVGPIVSRQGALLWNHGGSADDLTRPLVVPVSAPASTYFREAVELAHQRGLSRVVLAQGKGRFASAVISGAHQRAAEIGLAVQHVPLAKWATAESLTEAAVLIVGTFTEDLAVVEQIRAGPEPGLLGCVAAGLLEFGRRLGPTADGIVGPVQWIPHATIPAPQGPPSHNNTSRQTESHPIMWPPKPQRPDISPRRLTGVATNPTSSTSGKPQPCSATSHSTSRGAKSGTRRPPSNGAAVNKSAPT